ncbi:MAG TPA: SDR family oxidoreductase [Candidatus Udaeobacter sp.]|jgi:short-subunit dehydrogenase|nr:SDR family oxidoreductase [Candidatus Udaeobacter sp.]
MDFKDQVILITGASSGIGRSLAIDLAALGATVIGCGRSEERLRETLDQMQRTSPSSTVVKCDISDPEQVRMMINKALADYGKIDVLINNAGIGMRKPFVETSTDTIEQITRTNYLGTIYCTHEVLPSMIARGNGHIVNMSSGAGKIGSLNMAAYCASKFAVNGFSESLYHELKPLGIHVSVICPGPVRTAFNRSFADRPPKSPPSLIITPEAVSQAVMRVMETKKFEVVMPRWLALMCWLKRVTPNLFRSISHRTFRRHVVAEKKT